MTLFAKEDYGHDRWGLAQTARDFDRLTQEAPHFRELAAEVALRAVEPGAQRYVDLSGDVGVVARALIGKMSASASLCCVEPSLALMRRARKRAADERLFWLNAGAAQLVQVRGPAAFDVMTARFLRWTEGGILDLLNTAHEALRPGGVLVFSLPAEFLGEVQFRISPEWVAFARCLESVRALALGKTGGDQGARPKTEPDRRFASDAGVTPKSFEEVLFGARFGSVEVDRVGLLVSAEDHARWLSLPPNRARWLPGVLAQRQAEAARLLRVRARSLPPIVQNWFVVRAKRCVDQPNATRREVF